MTPLDPIVFRELQIINKVIEDETWLEGERRGCTVSPDDPVVTENVYRVIMRIGAEMHESLLDASPAAPNPAGESLPERHEAA